MKCPVGKGIKAAEMLYERYGKAPAAKLCNLVTNFVNSKEKNSKTIHNHNTKWGEEKRQLDMRVTRKRSRTQERGNATKAQRTGGKRQRTAREETQQKGS
jgi:hypothetical protein